MGNLSGNDADKEAGARLMSVNQMTILLLLVGFLAMPGPGMLAQPPG